MRSHITLSPKHLGLAVLMVALGGAIGTLIRDLSSKINLFTENLHGLVRFICLIGLIRFLGCCSPSTQSVSLWRRTYFDTD